MTKWACEELNLGPHAYQARHTKLAICSRRWNRGAEVSRWLARTKRKTENFAGRRRQRVNSQKAGAAGEGDPPAAESRGLFLIDGASQVPAVSPAPTRKGTHRSVSWSVAPDLTVLRRRPDLFVVCRDMIDAAFRGVPVWR